MTYTRDIIANLLHTETDRVHPDYPVADVIMPEDVLNAMAEELSTVPRGMVLDRTHSIIDVTLSSTLSRGGKERLWSVVGFIPRLKPCLLPIIQRQNLKITE